jgi:hypothetical protein
MSTNVPVVDARDVTTRLATRMSRAVRSTPRVRVFASTRERVRRRRSTRPSASYEKTWSNPSGSVIDVIDERSDTGAYACARPFVWNDIDVGGRMGVVKMHDGSLWIHSPIDLDAMTKRAVDALGPVKFIVSPNYEHVKYAKKWKDAYPEATLYGCPGLKAKTSGVIPYDVDLGDVPGACPPEWRGEFQCEHFDSERTPILGGAFFNEVVFHHVPTETLFITDLVWTYPERRVDGVDVPLGTRAWKALMDELYLPVYLNLMVRDRARFAASVRRLTHDWSWTTFVPCHGTVERGARARQIIRDHLSRSL